MTPDQAYDWGRVARRTGMRRSAREKEISDAMHAYWLQGYDAEAAGLPVPSGSILEQPADHEK